MVSSLQSGGASAANAPAPPFARRNRLAAWACAYALAIAYVSIVLGPDGVNFTPRDPAVAWRLLLATPYLATGSDQRPDWMANLLMLVPLGFLAAGALRPPRGILWQTLGAGGALFACLAFVVAVKYAQLFFPPRTVSLNYILAQSLGSIVGVALFCLSSGRLATEKQALSSGGRPALRALCRLYTLCYLLFLLFPFDVALSAEDLRQRAALLPALLFSWPGQGLPPPMRVGFYLVYTLAAAPVGMMLALGRRPPSRPKIVLRGFLLMAAVTLASALLLDATPSLAGLGLRSLGIAIGGMLAHQLLGGDPERWRNRLRRLVPWAMLPYAVAIVYAKGLLSAQWRTVPQALSALDPLGLLPFYHDYIVSKMHAAESAAAELLFFAPIGTMVALRRGAAPGSTRIAGAAAFFCALAIELGRWFKPGLQPDFSNAIIAALGAALAAGITAVLWRTDAPRPAAASDPGDSIGDRVSRQFPRRLAEESGRTRPAAAIARLAVALVCLSAAGWIAAEYPLAPWLLGAGLLLYLAALWRWPSIWLAVLPALLPAFDLAPWTGWLDIAEPDLFALVTIGVLALRAPPRAGDFRVRGLAAAALGLAALSCLTAAAIGLAMPGPAGGADNPYLRPDNALRVAKGFATALALLPFLRERLRASGDDALVWLGAGMAAGLSLVGVAAIVERALFPGLSDFTADYRVAGPFSAMHIGGGYIGAYLAMALPFILVCLVRPCPLRLTLMCAIALAGGYALVVTFSRAAYAAASLSMVIAVLGWGWAARRSGRHPAAAAALPGAVLLLIAGIMSGGVATPLMVGRLRQSSPDLSIREANWAQGLALHGRGLTASLFGTGLGTYPRIVLTEKPAGRFPTNFVLGRDGGYEFLSLSAGSPLYFGQKVALAPDQTYRLFVDLRSPDGRGVLKVFLCEKWLLYSDNCRSATLTPRAPARWEDFGAALPVARLGRPRLFNWLPRPVELSVLDPVAGTAINVGRVHLLDSSGHDVVANGDFSHGLERWFFTDDDHLVWRVENQFLLTFVESGALGLVALLLLSLAALSGAARAVGRGERMASCIAASLIGFLFCCLFNGLLDAPRLATLFYLVAFAGLSLGSPAPHRSPSSTR